MPNGGHICCEYCTYSRNPNRRCDIFGIETSPYILCRSFRKPKQSHVEARREWPVLNELKSGLVYKIDNSTFHAHEPIPIFKVSPFYQPMTADTAYARISAVLLVEHVLIAEFSGHTEFHVDCLAQGLCGDLFQLPSYYSSSEPAEIARLREQLREGNLLFVNDQALDVCGNYRRLLNPAFELYSGDEQEIRASFLQQKKLRDQETDKTSIECNDHIRGQVTECRILQTRDAGPMAIVSVETGGGAREAVIFPEVFSLYREELTQLGNYEFSGTFQEVDENPGPVPMVVERLMRI